VSRIFISLLMVIAVAGTGLGETVTILYTNDIHTRVEQLPGLSAAIEDERAAASGPVLLFDSGDTWQDYRVPIYAVWGAERTVEWMNAVGYDAMALGNHDLYYGPDRLTHFVQTADFPVLCANLRPVAGVKPPFTPYTFVQAGGLHVLVVGLITDEDLPYLDYPWLTYLDPAEALAFLLDEEEADKADLVVVLGHLPVAAAKRIAQRVPGIDVFLTGHSHELTETPVHVGKTVILQTGAFGQHLGILTLTVDSSGEVTKAANSFRTIEKTPVETDRGYIRLGIIGGLTLALLLLLF